MHERMLDKQTKPAPEEMAAYCGDGGAGFAALNGWLTQAFGTVQTVAFPYGAHYGWCVAHRLGKKLICNVFPERGAFTVMLRLDDRQWGDAYDRVSRDVQELIDHRYPCADGGWVHLRVSSREGLNDARLLLTIKCGGLPPAENMSQEEAPKENR